MQLLYNIYSYIYIYIWYAESSNRFRVPACIIYQIYLLPNLLYPSSQLYCDICSVFSIEKRKKKVMINYFVIHINVYIAIFWRWKMALFRMYHVTRINLYWYVLFHLWFRLFQNYFNYLCHFSSANVFTKKCD